MMRLLTIPALLLFFCCTAVWARISTEVVGKQNLSPTDVTWLERNQPGDVAEIKNAQCGKKDLLAIIEDYLAAIDKYSQMATLEGFQDLLSVHRRMDDAVKNCNGVE